MQPSYGGVNVLWRCLGSVVLWWGFGGFCRVQGFSGLVAYKECLVDEDFVVEDGNHEEVSGSGGNGLVLNF